MYEDDTHLTTYTSDGCQLESLISRCDDAAATGDYSEFARLCQGERLEHEYASLRASAYIAREKGDIEDALSYERAAERTADRIRAIIY